MSVGPNPLPRPPGGFVRPLLRARDWQDRPEFAELCQWWKDGGVGVCALVGIGGAGKTAIAERFLQLLPSGYPEHPKVSKDRSLEAPARLLVFSFYDAPNPDTFFSELAAWLEGRPVEEQTRITSYSKVLDLLASAGKCLLVLDGLEKVQDEGSRGGAFGQILDGRLRDLVVRATDGWLRQVSLVITSRFRLWDPLVARSWYYRQIQVERLQPPAAVQLLRDRGVSGTDDQLGDIAREQGYHALSVDLAGGYITSFCGGDSQRFLALPSMKKEDVLGSNLNPRIAAVRQQESRFAHLTEQYQRALARSDPAALALLQRVCLFRLGVGAKTLAIIFTGISKVEISGPGLAALTEHGLEEKLQLLVELRLVEASRFENPAEEAQVYTVHPAVRDGFLKGLDAEVARLGHDAARQGLEASLGGLPGDNPSDPATLDLLEEIVYHTLAADYTDKAWNIYWNRIGAFKNLGWRLGAYERGERICRAFSTDLPPQAAPLPAGLPNHRQAIFINEWGQYLKLLGQLVAAARCFERQNELWISQKNWKNASIGNVNLAEALLLAGRVRAGLHAAGEALRLADLADDAGERTSSYSRWAHASSLSGAIKASLSFFREALLWQHKMEGEQDRPLYTLRGVYQTLLFIRLGRVQEGTRLAEANKSILFEISGPRNHHEPLCNLLLADLARERDYLPGAKQLLQQAHEWALQRDAKELLCWSALVRVKIELSGFIGQRSANLVEARASLARAASSVEDGLRIARDCGYGIYHIDLLLVRAQLALYEGRTSDAERDIRVAIEEGIHPPEESRYPELLSATDPECLYAWGIAEGRHLLGEALLLQAAQKLSQAEFVPKQSDGLPSDVRELIDRAREQLEQALELWRKLRDPESDAEINPRGERTRHVLEGLAGGVLTEYPLVPDTPAPTSTPEPTSKESSIPMSSTPSVFVCYARADNRPPRDWLDRLLQHLSPLVRQQDLAVCSDQDLKIGDEWNPEIQRNLAAAKVAVLLVSPAFLASKYIASSEVPVLLKRAREGGLKILPVLLSPSLVHRTRFKWPDPKDGPEHFTLTSLQAAGSPSETLSEMTEPEQDRVFVALAERILEIVDAIP